MHTLAVTDQGTEIRVEADMLLLCRSGTVVRRVRIGEIEQLLLFGRVEITSAALAVLARRKMDVVFLSRQGYFRARLSGPSSPAAVLRLAQFRAAIDPAFCLRVVPRMIEGKIVHQRQLLLRAQRRLKDDDLAGVLGQMRILAEQCVRQTDLDTLRGLEGRAAALYFSQFSKLILVPELAFNGRSRRPPRDPVNACLSFGYVMLGRVIETEVLRCGLDPQIGFFHQPHDGRPSLMLDLLEEFRPFVDALVLRLVNRRQLGPLDFEQSSGESLEEILAETIPPASVAAPEAAVLPAPVSQEAGVGESQGKGVGTFLGDTGRRIFLIEFFRRLRERLYYPPRQGSFELRDVVREQAYHLARVIDGRERDYQPFVPG